MANFQSTSTFVGRALSGFVVAAIGSTPGGRLSGWNDTLIVRIVHANVQMFTDDRSLTAILDIA